MKDAGKIIQNQPISKSKIKNQKRILIVNEISKKPLVSVVISSYNHEPYIEQTIESIVNQTYSNIEIIVFDDGSTDNSPVILDKLSKKYNFYFERQKNIGLSATLNKGLYLSKGKYLL